jgi:D-arabinose 1-dehydrogenase-like Zn-dependent alcohol dehydrogenase
MKAAIVESPGRLMVKEIPSPTVGEYGALCRLLFGATCSGTDIHLIADKMPWKVQYPMVLGHESIGRVIEVGKKVRYLRVGDLVTRVGTLPIPEIGLNISWGGFSEMGIAIDHRAMREDGLPADQWNGSRINQVIPASYDPGACTMMITWRETLSYIRRLGVTAGSRVLVLGTGGNALAFVAHARNLGAAAIACVGSLSRRGSALACGATLFLDYKTPDVAEAIGDDCRQFDFLIDGVGKSGQIDRVLRLLRDGGMVGVYGLDDFDGLGINPLRARGTFTIYGGGYDEAETHDEVVRRMAEGALDAKLWLNLSSPFELQQITEAFEAVGERRVIKAVIRLSPE